MRRSGTTRLNTLPRRKADFIEPMDCAPVPKLIDGPDWVYEILCGPPHKILWRPMLCGAGGEVLAKEAHASAPRRHIISIKGFAGTASVQPPAKNPTT